MNVGAHPLIVAVAMGLLGPLALAEEDRSECEAPRPVPCPGCTCERAEVAPSEASEPVLGAAEVESAWAALLREPAS